MRPIRNVSKNPFHANWHCLKLQRIHSCESPTGDFFEGAREFSGGCEGQFTRELGRPAGSSGELGVLAQHPPALVASRHLPCSLASVPWTPCPGGGVHSRLILPVPFGFFNLSVFWYSYKRASVLVMPGGGAIKKKTLEIFECCWFCFLHSVSFVL